MKNQLTLLNSRQIGCEKIRGFSLIEVLLSVFLVTIGLVAAIGLISKGMLTSIDARNQLIASGLAQEGIELVRNIRDNNWQNTDPAASSFTNITVGNNCRIDKDYSGGAIDCSASSKRLYINGGFYTHTAGSATRFQRELTISGTTERVVTSFVSWNGAVPPSNIANCSVTNKCAYAQITLSTFGEN